MNSRLVMLLKLIAVAGLLASGAAVASELGGPGGAATWTVYAFSNAQAVADTFRSLANFAASSTFQAIVGFIAVGGVLAIGVSAGFSPAAGKKFLTYCVSVFLVTFIFFGVGSSGPLTVQVEVYDVVDGTWVAPVTVPAVVGVPASVISTAGHAITQQVEASFPLPDAMKMSNGAPFNLAAAMIADASRARITDPNLASSLAYYVQDCFVPAVARGEKNATDLISSTQFLADIRWPSEAVLVNTLLEAPVGSASLVSCLAAWTLINDKVASLPQASDYLNQASAWAKTPALSVVNSAADTVAQWASNNGVSDGGALVKQSAVLAAFSSSFQQAAAATGNSDFLTGLNLAQAETTQRNGWIMGAEVFNRSMGYIFAILQVFVYAITPLVLAAALIPGLGGKLLLNFGQILLWLALWQPVLSIVNFIVLSMQQADLGGALAAGGTYGFTLSNMGLVSEKTATMRAAALFIGTMVPALTWALVKGSVDFSKFIGEGVGEKFAHSAANSMATGSYSLNQASMDSFTANKHSLGATGDWGNGFTNTVAGGVNRKIDVGGTTAERAGQKNEATNSATLSAAEAQQRADALAKNKTGADGKSNTESGGVNGGRSLVVGGSEGDNSTTVTALSALASAGIDLRALVDKFGAPTPAIPAANAPAGSGGGDGTKQPAASAKEVALGDANAKIQDKKKNVVSANVGFQGQAGASSQRSHADTKNANKTIGTTESNVNADLASVTGGASDSTTATATGSITDARNQTLTGAAAGSDRLDAMRPLLNRDPSPYGASRHRAPGAAPSSIYQQTYGNEGSRISAVTAELGQPGAVERKAEELKPSIDAAKKDAKTELKRIEDKNTAKRDATEKDREQRDAALKTYQAGLQALGHRGALSAAVDATLAMLPANASDEAKAEARKKAEDAVNALQGASNILQAPGTPAAQQKDDKPPQQGGSGGKASVPPPNAPAAPAAQGADKPTQSTASAPQPNAPAAKRLHGADTSLQVGGSGSKAAAPQPKAPAAQTSQGADKPPQQGGSGNKAAAPQPKAPAAQTSQGADKLPQQGGSGNKAPPPRPKAPAAAPAAPAAPAAGSTTVVGG